MLSFGVTHSYHYNLTCQQPSDDWGSQKGKNVRIMRIHLLLKLAGDCHLLPYVAQSIIF